MFSGGLRVFSDGRRTMNYFQSSNKESDKTEKVFIGIFIVGTRFGGDFISYLDSSAVSLGCFISMAGALQGCQSLTFRYQGLLRHCRNRLWGPLCILRQNVCCGSWCLGHTRIMQWSHSHIWQSSGLETLSGSMFWLCMHPN